jgi:MIP family channel proteins
MTQQQVREATAEGIGTFMLILVGAGAVALNPGNLLVAAFAHGLILIAIIAAYGHISGAHVNPAVTLGVLIGGKMELNRALIYWVSQIIGALVAVLVLRIVIPSDFQGFNPLETLGQTAPADGVNALGIVVIEGLLAFFLVSSVYQAAIYGKGGAATPLLIGLTLAACIVLGGPLTGASVNPARTLGPAFLAEDVQDLGEVFTYMIGLFTGGAAAGLLHSDIFAQETTENSKKSKKKS